ncbi:MAG: D-2-hydroxyacid dehydrogenase [Lysobacterales bacterium]
MNRGKGVFLDAETIDPGDLDRASLESSLDTWDWHSHSSPSDVPLRTRNARVVISNKCPLDRSVLAGAAGLELVAVAATGTNIIDLEAAREQGITVCNIRDYCSDAVAQHVISLSLCLLGGLPWYRDRVRRGDWSRARQFCLMDRPIRQAKGLVFGVIGQGTLGRASGELARGLGMRVMFAERKGREPRTGRVRFDDVLRQADVLSIHCPLTAETRDLIGAGELDRMKPDAVLINTARGGIVDERALADALRRGAIGGAGVDTLSEEPPPPDHLLLADDIPNLIVTPHNAWASRTARQAALDQLAEVIEAYLAGNPINVVSPV